jgi:hypothetical protein
MKKSLLVETFSFLLILLFVYTASSKLIDFHKFVGQLGRHPFIGRLPLPVAIGVITSELLVALLLVFPTTKRIGFGGSAGLLSVFTLYLTVMLSTHRHLPCACGGVIRFMTWKQHVFFNLFFLIISLLGIAFTINRGSRKPVETSRQEPPSINFSV